METGKKYFLIFIIVAVLAGIGIGIYASNSQALPASSENKIPKRSPEATLVIDNGKGEVEKYQVKTGENTDAFDVLQDSEAEFKYNNSDMGIMVNSIEGTKSNQDKKKYWMFYVNGKMAKKGVGQKEIEAGDKVKFKYQKSKF